MLKWIATLSGILGAVLVAFNNGFQFLGYIGFLTGSIIWLVISIKQKENAAIAQWAFFTSINLFGLYNYL